MVFSNETTISSEKNTLFQKEMLHKTADHLNLQTTNRF